MSDDRCTTRKPRTSIRPGRISNRGGCSARMVAATSGCAVQSAVVCTDARSTTQTAGCHGRRDRGGRGGCARGLRRRAAAASMPAIPGPVGNAVSRDVSPENFAVNHGGGVMSPSRAPRICPEPGCSRLIHGGAKRCEEHFQPWANKSFDTRRSDTAAHRRLKTQVFVRANYCCEIADSGCLGVATEIDRIDNARGYDLDNLQGACTSCHAKKTGREGRAAQLGHEAPEPNAAAPRPVAPPRRPVRGRRRRAFDGVSAPKVIWTDPI